MKRKRHSAAGVLSPDQALHGALESSAVRESNDMVTEDESTSRVPNANADFDVMDGDDDGEDVAVAWTPQRDDDGDESDMSDADADDFDEDELEDSVKRKRPGQKLKASGDGSDSTLPKGGETPVKRGRGRPKGSKNKSTLAAMALTPNTGNVASPVVEFGGQKAGETPVKRGRGRPKGTTNKAKLEALFGIAPIEENPVPLNEDGTPIKRGRGRPKGSKNKPKNPLLPVKQAAQSTNLAAGTGGYTSIAHVISSTLDASLRQMKETAASNNEAMLEPGALQAPDGAAPAADDAPPDVPIKRGRGRPKGSKNRVRTPSPLRNLPPHEQYFSQNRPGGIKTSDNTLSSLALLDHEEFFNLAKLGRDSHKGDMEFLRELHERSFNQWQFELIQGFNICVYGWGSKKSLLLRFAEYASKMSTQYQRHVVVINGYMHTTSMREILNTIAVAIAAQDQRLGSQPVEVLENLSSLLSADPSVRIILIVNSIDAVPLRRAATQTLLSRLASHPQVCMVASADHPSFPLLWDSSLRSSFNFVFHDCTTFQPFTTEVDVVDDVHEILGRSNRRIGGREGVAFVLRSLPENAKNLFRVLVAEQLAMMDENGGFGSADEDDEDDYGDRIPRSLRTADVGIEYRLLYQKATEEFICGNEVAFRTLLKEFHDHQMIQSRKDILGAEILSVPFRKEELETILEDLMS